LERDDAFSSIESAMKKRADKEEARNNMVRTRSIIDTFAQRGKKLEMEEIEKDDWKLLLTGAKKVNYEPGITIFQEGDRYLVPLFLYSRSFSTKISEDLPDIQRNL
jgi:ribosomal protein L9